MAAQTYETHRRFDPAYHIATFGLMLAALVLAVVELVRHPGLGTAWALAATLALWMLFALTRSYPLKAQDRLIRLEETLRMQRLFPEGLKARIHQLEPAQFVALRFAPDAELADRTREALEGKLDREAIKKRIQVWRPDTFRI